MPEYPSTIDQLVRLRAAQYAFGAISLPATALTPKYATPLLKAIDFAPPAPSRRIVLAWRDGFPRRAALAAIAAAIPKLGLPVDAATTPGAASAGV